MAQRHNHYETAFKDYVRSRGWPYLAVDEQRKAIFSGARIKSFDFLVYPPGPKAWLVDIKGRKFPYETGRGRRYWENWVPREDLEGLSRWQEVFGDSFEPMLVFAYWLVNVRDREPGPDVHVFRDSLYSFVPVSVCDYASQARTRSPKWDTVSVPAREFRSLARRMEAYGPE